MLFRRSGSELFDIHEYYSPQNISTIKYLFMKNDKFQENLSRPGIIDAKARYRVAARRLRNTALKYRIDGPIMVEIDQNTQLYLKKERWLCSRDSKTNCF